MTTADAIGRAYDAAAVAVVSAADVDDDQETFALRSVVAYVKACVLDGVCKAVPQGAVTVVDAACGRGQDLGKLHHALVNAGGKALRALYCLDVADKALEVAQAMAHKFFGASGAIIHVQTRDVASGEPLCDDGTADVVSCQLALHYWCDDPAHVKRFFVAAAACSQQQALLAVTFPDGRWIVRAGRNRLGTEAVQEGKVCIQRGALHVVIGADALGAATPSAFGVPYEFTLGRRRVVGSTEFLVHEGAVTRLAADAGWTCVAWSARCDDASRLFRSNPRLAGIADAMRTADATIDAALFRAVVFTKTKEAAARFQAAMRL